MNFARRCAAAGGWLLAGSVAVLSICGCQGARMKVESAWGPGIKAYGLGSTYDWWPGELATGSDGSGHVDNPEFDEFIRTTIEKRMAAKGYRREQSSEPDLWIDYLVLRKEKGGLARSSLSPITVEGSLVIDVLDPQTGRHMWRGYAQARMNDAAAPSARRERIATAVRLILDKFPNQGSD